MNSSPLAFGLGRLARFALPVIALAFAAVTSVAAVDPASQTIDKLVDEALAKAGEHPNAPLSDEAFLRRIYLDVIGRIPTAEEATAFLNDKSAEKRSALVSKLLASDGYVSHWFNYWADILRVKSNPTEGAPNGSGEPYALWIKEQLKYNTPYDKMVHGMLTAQGYLWDNGAVGYYMRDSGMPLDNMANTCQVFLGTRVACAQCHNHPFDDYKQRDFYEMAAYTCGMQTKVQSRDIIAEANGKKKLSKNEAKKLAAPGVIDELDRLLEPLSYGTRQNYMAEQKLPDDFRGDPKNPNPREGKPGEIVKAQPVFSREKIKTGKEVLDNYASWMTSPENPTFTVVIANRLWKQAFGIGLIEPVDDIKKVDLDKNNNDATKLASNPALMGFLTQHMKACKYDMKKFLSAIYNSKAYQREATASEIHSIEDYKFPGPIVRRMTAEQLWDTMVTLVIPAPDERKSAASYGGQLATMKANADKLQEKLKGGNGKALLEYATALAKVKKDFDERLAPLRKRLADARAKNDKPTVDATQAEIDKIESARFDANKKAYDESTSKTKSDSGPFSKPSPMMEDKDKMKKDQPVMSAADEARYANFDKEWIRASELPSPAPNGHFLREFGQSERLIIQGANTESSVTQALAMLNGPLFDKLIGKNTQLGQVLNATKTADEKRDLLFLTLFSRLPDDREKAIVSKALQGDNQMVALRKVAWALVNTREFTFVK